MGSTKYITSMGELSQKDFSLCFRKNDKNTYIPIENLKEIYCLNEISLNTKVLDFLARNRIILHLFNYYGNYCGTFYPRDWYNSGRLLIRQVEKHRDSRMEAARGIVIAIAQNIKEVLYHYYKHDCKEVKGTIDFLRKEVPEKVVSTTGIAELMSVEGEIWARFYGEFKNFLSEDFALGKRAKRPPDNPMNAMISFGNTLLYGATITAIYRTHLDQRISYLHEPSEGRFSLSLDLAEAFKPAIVYRTIFELVNNRRIRAKEHFEKKLNYCILNETGREIFIRAFEERMDSTFMHSKLKRRVSYKTAIKLDGYKLIKWILEDKPFHPFSLEEGM